VRRVGAIEPRQLSLLAIGVLLLAMAGCSTYEPKIHTGKKTAPQRTMQQVVDDIIKSAGDVEKTFETVKDAAAATRAVPDVKAKFDHLKELFPEAIASLRRETADDRTAFMSRASNRLDAEQTSLVNLANDRSKVAGLPDDFTEALKQIKDELPGLMQQLNNVPDEPAAQVSTEFVADSEPENSGWPVWLLCLLILAACTGFLCRDGLWNNAVRLVNVIFAGLLAMNFYEWVASWLIGLSDSIRPWQPLADFLSWWGCFAIIMVVFRAVSDAVSPVRVRFLKVADQAGGIALSVCIGWVMICFTLASLHAAPLGQYPLLGAFKPQEKMLFGILAPDREWLGFIKYQSSYGYSRVEEKDYSFPSDFIEKQMQRRQHIEKYIHGNPQHAILVNQQFMRGSPKPGERPNP